MLKKLGLVIALTTTISACTYNTKHEHWSYAGDTGAAHWGDIYHECKGDQQSPVDIWGKHHSKLQDIKFDYRTFTVINNGHTVQYNYDPISHMSFMGDDSYKLIQFHFHVPSEHTLDGKRMAMGAHFVHKNSKNELAVVGILFREGKTNPIIEKLWKHFPKNTNIIHDIDEEDIDIQKLLPKNLAYYHYIGSLTTPPCTQNIKWIVMRHTVEASKAQIDRFRKAIGGDNSRPVQRILKD